MPEQLPEPAGPTIGQPAQRVDAAVVQRAAGIATATLHEAGGRIGALPAAIKPVAPAFRIAGTAVTVHSPGGDNLWLHRALYVARPGDVLVVSVAGEYEYGYWGEIMSTAAKARGLAGLVIDGCVRDARLLGEIGFPVFSRGLCIRGTGKDYGATGFVNHPLLVGDVQVCAGDLVVGDEDGVVVLPVQQAPRIVDESMAREAKEAQIIERLLAGERTLEAYNFK